MQKTGILLIAVGDGFYSQLAYNLALTLKQADAYVEIALLTDDPEQKTLLPHQKKVFDHFIKCEDKDYIENYRINPFLLKTKIYKYSPFVNTLFLDADQLFLNENKSLKELLDKLSQYDFQIHEVSRYTRENAHLSGMIWTKTADGQKFPELFEEYNIPQGAELPEYNSSFIWFKKTPANKKYFALVERNYFVRPKAFQQIGTFYPDEMTWNISSAQLKHYSAISGWKPCFLNWEITLPTLAEIEQKFYFLNMASGYQPGKQLVWYDNLCKRARMNSGDQFPFNFDMHKKIFFQKQ